MVLHLHSTRMPSGRCLALAQAIGRVSQSARSTHIAEELFTGKHPRENPVVLHVTDEKNMNDLRELCSQYGIAVNVESGE